MHRKPVLVVEDDSAIRECMRELFEGDGFPSLFASNGLEALELLRSSESLPGIIFLDLMMPIMDGERFLKERERLSYAIRAIPVVIVSAAAGPFKDLRPAVGFMKKPIEINAAIAWAERYCLKKAS